MSYQQGGYNYGQAEAGQQYGYQGAPPYGAQAYSQAPQQGAYGQVQQPLAPHQSYAADPSGAYPTQAAQFATPQQQQPGFQAGAQQSFNSAYGSSAPPQPYMTSTGPLHQQSQQGYGSAGAQTAPQHQQHRLGAPAPANGMTVAPPLNYPPAPFRSLGKGSAGSQLPRLSSYNSGGFSTYGAPATQYQDPGGQQQWGMQSQPQQYAPPPPY